MQDELNRHCASSAPRRAMQVLPLPERPVPGGPFWERAVRARAVRGLVVLAFAASVCSARAAGSDTDDERLTLPEVKLAAAARFDKLDRDGDGTLDPAEVVGRVGKAEFRAADTDHDGTLNKDEYLALVEKLFDRADVRHDGSLDVAELRSKSGRALKPLIS